jgi:2-polyprenyl-3-methyl-5-hydroxy-6-metoxy-1,4-benzoquinol methylase
MKTARLKILAEREPSALVAAAIKARGDNGSLNILEAGCGRRWPFDLAGTEYRLTGVDLDQAALEIRKTRERDLHEAIHGDLRTVALPAGAYDVIYNSYVLEHVDGAEQVLRNFLLWAA